MKKNVNIYAHQILNVIDKNLTKNFRNTLKKINYNNKKDNLIVFSDHGLTISPESKLYTEKVINKNKYDLMYKNIFLDEKIKMLFFVNSPKINSKKIKLAGKVPKINKHAADLLGTPEYMHMVRACFYQVLHT